MKISDDDKMEVIDLLCNGGLIAASKFLMKKYKIEKLSDACFFVSEIKREVGGM
jgi:hypothetical protein